MKKTMTFMLLGLILTACESAPSVPAPGSASTSGSGSVDNPKTSVPTTASVPSVPVSATVPAPAVTPSPSPSPTPYSFPSGSGTIGSPYAIETRTDFEHIVDHSAAYYNITQDVDMSGGSFSPIASFSGVIYGNNHHLYNLVITKTDGTTAALFTALSGTITSLVLQSVTISSNGYATGFAGTLTGQVSGSITGNITSGLGGNGFNTGTGNCVYVTKSGPGSATGTVENAFFNGNHVSTTL